MNYAYGPRHICYFDQPPPENGKSWSFAVMDDFGNAVPADALYHGWWSELYPADCIYLQRS